MVGYYNQGVPASADLENNSNQKKYTVNRGGDKGGLVISKPLCTLMAIGALLLAILAGLVVFFLVPRGCAGDDVHPQALQKHQPVVEDGESRLQPDSEEVEERLPRDLMPTHYRIQIRPYFENYTTAGTETVTLLVEQDTDVIIFHANKIKIDRGSVRIRPADPPDANPIDIVSQEYLDGERYKLVLKTSLSKESLYYLTLDFVGELNAHLQGFYLSRYTSHSGEPRTSLSTQFSPTDARRAFPCFDEPSFKAKFVIKIARPSNMSTLSNMPVEKTDVFDTGNGAWLWDTYPETPEMPTYLVAFLVSDLVKMQSSDRLISVWARKEYVSHSSYALEVAPKVLRYFEEYFRISFPLPKIDIAAVPEFGFSAMENWGLITFRESTLLFDPLSSTVEDQRAVATVLSHEIAHQWFGNLVTPRWWNDLWLKEGFATYLEYLGVDHAQPTWKITEEFLPSEIEKAMSVDSLESSRPISFNVVNGRQIKQAFDDISYAKGACIIRMMNHFLGEDTFRNGLAKFLDQHKYGNADRDDLFRSLSEEAHLRGVLLQNETVKHIMDTWTEQAGFPVLNVVPDYEKNALRILQKRFLISNSKGDGSKWWVPISYTTSVRPDFADTKPRIWLREEPETTADVDPIGDWYLLNLNQTGYYVVNYDEKNWKSLSANIMSLPPLIRAQLISDSMDLARANQLDYSIPLTMIARMAIQDKMIMFVPTTVAFSKLKYLSDILHSTPAFGLFEEYHNAIFKGTYNLVDFDDSIEDYLTRRIRQTVLEWSCRSPESVCVHKSRYAFRKWMVDGNMILPNLRPIAYCTAIREGSEIEWDFAYQKYLEATSPTEKNVLLDALGCTKQKWLLSRYVRKLTDTNDENYSIRIQDADRVFESVAKNKEGTNIAFDFIRKNWNELLTHYGDGFNILGKMIKSVAVHMNTDFQLAELERFRDTIRPNISTTTNAFDSATETVRSNVNWLKRNYQQVDEWLKKYHNQFGYIQ
ncbi:aminopeptidase N-like isoform X2 [Cylas formicarius]|uniref:aminopeptidase N-like isoform X2 n=1 Tax=Cylas formicarius TaxID=197179 RepID=UPI002958A6BD|nr:aminopeptidase N-like isoform X2 [Cylas formicarius]